MLKMTKPITKIASEATHGGEDVGSPAPYVNKMAARTSQMVHKSWPKLMQGQEDGSEYAKTLASENQDLGTEPNQDCEEGYIKDDKGQCVESGKNLNTEINTEGDGGGGDLGNPADQTGGDA